MPTARPQNLSEQLLTTPRYRTPVHCVSLHPGDRTPISCACYTRAAGIPQKAYAYCEASEPCETASYNTPRYRAPGHCISLHPGDRTPTCCICYTQHPENAPSANSSFQAPGLQYSAPLYSHGRELLLSTARYLTPISCVSYTQDTENPYAAYAH